MRPLNITTLFCSSGFGLSLLCIMGCAGPHSPFGAIDFGSNDGRPLTASSMVDSHSPESAAEFLPKRQVLHQAADLDVDFSKDSGIDRKTALDLRVEYNGRDVTHAFLHNIRLASDDKNPMHYTYFDLRLTPNRRHDISFYYRTSKSEPYRRAQYLPPVCNMFAPFDLKTTSPFEPKADLLKLINANSKKYGMNPNFLAGLIAQESGFDPQAETWAHAIGLTQITPIAKSQIEALKPKWKFYRRGDWRLSPARSIEGGAVYLQFLTDYWTDTSAQDVLKDHNVQDLNSVILASYNSGAARVKKDIVDADESWLRQDNLKEAFRYVNRVTSYCYHFSGGQE